MEDGYAALVLPVYKSLLVRRCLAILFAHRKNHLRYEVILEADRDSNCA